MVIADSERLFLRHLHITDDQALDLVFGDPEVMYYGPGAQNRQWVREWLRGCLESYQTAGFGMWGIVEKSSRSVMGCCGFRRLRTPDGPAEIELGYRLARRYWGRGYATEAARAALDYGFKTLCLPRLIAVIDPRNVASLRVAEKIGMKCVPDTKLLEGVTPPEQVYALAQDANA